MVKLQSPRKKAKLFILQKPENGITKQVASISGTARSKPLISKRRQMDIRPVKFAIARVHHQIIALIKAPAPAAWQVPKKVRNASVGLVPVAAIAGSISS